MTTQPLFGIQVLDFTTLLPGPLCSLLLREAGADVLKIERPGAGDEMRSYQPRFGPASSNFAMLNRGKRSTALDLKTPEGLERVLGLVREADVLIEQFRPGVMDRLGLGWDDLKAVNPRLIYCSITGYGQHGVLASEAGHDLNYVAASGMLSLTAGRDGTPALPAALVADIGGGTYPAVLNILLALRARDVSGQGTRLDIAMCESLFTFMYWGLGEGWITGAWPRAGSGLLTGRTPRYQIYRTREGRFLAAAPLEDRFWTNFLHVLGAEHLQDPSLSPPDVQEAISAIIAQCTAEEWLARFEGVDACVNLVRTLDEAVKEQHFADRGAFQRRIEDGRGGSMPALPVPIARQFRDARLNEGVPVLGEAG
ncbi:MAG TPA: CaiB/BaiF CoA-transferase family protein [Ramlibacter sp.]|nr:CaiB/BaiF CoA-transferase family protein [Ramlibacter sp.]